MSGPSDVTDGIRLDLMLALREAFRQLHFASPTVLSIWPSSLSVTAERVFFFFSRADGDSLWCDAAIAAEYFANVLSSLSFAFPSSRLCWADNVDTFVSARLRLTITLKAVSGSGLLHICCFVSSSKENWLWLGVIASQASQACQAFLFHWTHPCHRSNCQTLCPIDVDEQREARNRNHRSIWYFSLEVHNGPMDLEGVWTWYDEWALSVMSFQVRPSHQERQVELFVQGCGMGDRDVSVSCIDVSSSARAGWFGGTMSGPIRGLASCCCGQNVLPLFGFRVLRGSQSVISASEASWGITVCIVRSRIVLCVANVKQGLGSSWLLCLRCCTIFSRTRNGNASAVLHSEQENDSQWCTRNCSFERFQRLFLVFEVTHGLDQEGIHQFSFWNFCVCQIFQYQHHSFAAHRFQGRAWWISLRRFRSDSSYSMYALYDSSFPRRVEQDGFPQNRFVWRCLSQQQLPRRHNTICVQCLLSIGTFIEYFLNCDFVRSSWSYTCCLMVSSVFPSTLFFQEASQGSMSGWVLFQQIGLFIMISPVTLHNPCSVDAFYERRSVEDSNDQVPDASEKLWFGLCLFLVQLPSSKLAVQSFVIEHHTKDWFFEDSTLMFLTTIGLDEMRCASNYVFHQRLMRVVTKTSSGTQQIWPGRCEQMWSARILTRNFRQREHSIDIQVLFHHEIVLSTLRTNTPPRQRLVDPHICSRIVSHQSCSASQRNTFTIFTCIRQNFDLDWHRCARCGTGRCQPHNSLSFLKKISVQFLGFHFVVMSIPFQLLYRTAHPPCEVNAPLSRLSDVQQMSAPSTRP